MERIPVGIKLENELQSLNNIKTEGYISGTTYQEGYYPIIKQELNDYNHSGEYMFLKHDNIRQIDNCKYNQERGDQSQFLQQQYCPISHQQLCEQPLNLARENHASPIKNSVMFQYGSVPEVNNLNASGFHSCNQTNATNIKQELQAQTGDHPSGQVNCNDISSTESAHVASDLRADVYNVSRHFLCTNKQVTENPDNSNKKHVCDICFKRFKCKTYLIAHRAIHTGNIPFKCNVCNKECLTKQQLIYHEKIHTGNKPHKCETCPKSFMSSKDLRHHIRTHTGEKPYRCETCQRCFSLKKNYETHLRTHTKEKPYGCKTCGKLFSRMDHLKHHIRIHTGEKPFRCDICAKSFSRKCLLMLHIRYTFIKKIFIDKNIMCRTHLFNEFQL